MIRRALLWLTTHILPPPRVIKDRQGKTPYLSRWYLVGGAKNPSGRPAFNAEGNPDEETEFRPGIHVYLHRFHRSDDDDAPHNHPWRWAVSFVLAGGYSEERRTKDDRVVRRDVRPPAINVIRHTDFHRVDLYEEDAWSIFVAGPRIADWGFWDRVTKEYWPWRDFIAKVRGPGWESKQQP